MITVLLCALLTLISFPLAGLAADSLTAGLTTSVSSAAVGETFTVSIVADGVQNAADVLLTYDSTLVTYVSAAEEPRYAAGGKILFLDVDTDQSGTINTFTFQANESVTLPDTAVFTIQHARFAESLEAMTMDAKDAALTAASVSVNILPKYTVQFTGEDGSVIKSQTVVYNDKAEAPGDRIKTGYTFMGWNDGTDTLSGNVISKIPVTADVTYKAVFAVNKYAVKFTDELGNELSTQTVEYGKTAKAPSDTAKAGYIFLGWNDGGSTRSETEVNAKTVTAETTYRAEYALSFTLTQNRDYVGGYVRVLLTDAVLDGYTFDGSAMYRLTDSTFAFLYPLAQGAELPTEAELREKIAAAASTDADHDLSAQYGTGDVNYNAENTTNEIDIADARAAFNCQNVTCAVEEYMDVYLRADIDHDGTVDAKDVDTILSIIENGYATET